MKSQIWTELLLAIIGLSNAQDILGIHYDLDLYAKKLLSEIEVSGYSCHCEGSSYQKQYSYQSLF